MNKEVTATGMTVNAQAPASLVISKTSATAASAVATVALTDTSGTDLIPCSHGDFTTYDTGLYYNKKPENIDITTGLGTLVKDNAQNGTPSGANYYIDYTVYISSPGEEMTGATLNATLSTEATLTTTWYATSVDFYTGSVSSANYKGTLNLAGLDNTKTDGSTKTAVAVLSSGTIPQNTVGAVTVIMRVYFDGALQNGGTAYVNSTAYTTSALNFTAKFTLAD